MIGPGKKKNLLKLTFRAPDRTLTHEEVDQIVEALQKELGAYVPGYVFQSSLKSEDLYQTLKEQRTQ
jgi:hypothetical protein